MAILLAMNASHPISFARARQPLSLKTSSKPRSGQHQLRGRAADRVAMNADGREARRDQPAHFEIAEPDDRNRLRRGRTGLQ
jgi:hypothetical protein